jgi:hypothetical protein
MPPTTIIFPRVRGEAIIDIIVIHVVIVGVAGNRAEHIFLAYTAIDVIYILEARIFLNGTSNLFRTSLASFELLLIDRTPSGNPEKGCHHL